MRISPDFPDPDRQDAWQGWGFALLDLCHVFIWGLFSTLRLPCFFVPACAVIAYSGEMRHKKGGVNDLGKLRSEAERFCLRLLICLGEARTARRAELEKCLFWFFMPS